MYRTVYKIQICISKGNAKSGTGQHGGRNLD